MVPAAWALPDFVGATEVKHYAAHIRFMQDVEGSDLKNNREANFAGQLYRLISAGRQSFGWSLKTVLFVHVIFLFRPTPA
jgi:hypothetical protein